MAMPIVSRADTHIVVMNIKMPKRGLKKYDEKNIISPSIKSKLISLVKRLACLLLNIFGNSKYGSYQVSYQVFYL